jgi:hypothetical protein
MQHFCLYLSRLPYVIMENFELWGVYEHNFSEAIIDLLAWQLCEDIISHLINWNKQRQVE